MLVTFHAALTDFDHKVTGPADDWKPSSEDICDFFVKVVTHNQVRGPGWQAELTGGQLLAAADALRFPGLSAEECDRVMRELPRNAEGKVTYEEFRQALHESGARELLRSIVHFWVAVKSNGFAVSANYDYAVPTFQAYLVKETSPDNFVGKFAAIRATLDYSYHNNYSPERQRWQDAAIESVISREGVQSAPWLVYTCGPMGVGKGYALSWMSKFDYFPLEYVVHVDPDQFKSMMPEWPGYVSHDSASAGTMCHKESCMMMEVAQEAAMEHTQNVWIDGSLRDGDWYTVVFRKIRERYPHYRIAIFYVNAPEATIRDRVKERARKTGRDVPERLLKASMTAMDHALNALTPLCDFVARIDNSGPEPSLNTFERVDTSGKWSLIRDQFLRVDTNGHN